MLHSLVVQHTDDSMARLGDDTRRTHMHTQYCICYKYRSQFQCIYNTQRRWQSFCRFSHRVVAERQESSVVHPFSRECTSVVITPNRARILYICYVHRNEINTGIFFNSGVKVVFPGIFSFILFSPIHGWSHQINVFICVQPYTSRTPGNCCSTFV